MRLRSSLLTIGVAMLCCVAVWAQSSSSTPNGTPAPAGGAAPPQRTPRTFTIDGNANGDNVTIGSPKENTAEVHQVDLEGLKKLLERDPKDPQPLLINFWATWCDPCREEFPDLVKIDTDYRAKKLNVVAVSLDDIAEIGTTVPKFLSEMKASMPVVLLNVNDPEPAIKLIDASWDGQLPATFLYDKDGKVVFKHFGRFKTDELRAAIEKAVGSKQ